MPAIQGAKSLSALAVSLTRPLHRAMNRYFD